MDILQFNDITADSPHVNNLVKATWKDLASTPINIKRLHDAFCSIRMAENELVMAYRILSETIRSVIDQHGQQQQLGLQFASFVDEICELHQFLTEDMDVCLISRLNEFIQIFNEISVEAEHLSQLDKAKEVAYHNYMKLPKRCSKKLLHASLLDLAKQKRACESTTAVYYGQLNKASRIREMAPFLAITAFLNNQSEFVNSMKRVFGDTTKTFTKVAQTTFVDQVDSEHKMTQTFLDLSEEISQRPLLSFLPEPWNVEEDCLPDELPSKPNPNTLLCSKTGHLLIRNRSNLMWRWVDVFCSTQNGNLMSQLYTEIAASLLIDLNQKGVYAEPADCDDRRNVFQVVSPTEHKTVILQADSEVERDEWISTLTNIIFDTNSFENRLASVRQTQCVSTATKTRPVPPRDKVATSPSPTACYLRLVPVHLSLPALPDKRLEVGDMAQPTSSQVSSTPCHRLFSVNLLGALQFPEKNLAPSCDSVELNHLFSYVLSCRSASDCKEAPNCLLHVKDDSVWILGQRIQPEVTETMLAYSVLAIVPFSCLHNWLLCSDNPKLACLSTRLPLAPCDDNGSSFSGCSCFVIQSEKNNEFSEALLEALLRRIDLLQDEDGVQEKEALLVTIAQLSDAAIGYSGNAGETPAGNKLSDSSANGDALVTD